MSDGAPQSKRIRATVVRNLKKRKMHSDDRAAPAPIGSSARTGHTKQTKLSTFPVWLCIQKNGHFHPVIRLPTTTKKSIRLNRKQWFNWLKLSVHNDQPPALLLPDRYGNWRYLTGKIKEIKQKRKNEPCVILT